MTVDREAGTAGTEPHGRLRPQVHAGSQRTVADALVAGGVAALLSGLPSTLHAMSTGGDPLEASRAAGTLLIRNETRSRRLLAAAALVHGILSLGWSLVLARTLPARRTAAAGGLAGAAIAALDLGLVGRHHPRIRRLPLLPQVADHVSYGVVVGAVLAGRGRSRDHDVVAVRALPGPPGRCFTAWLGPDQPRLRSESQAVQAGHAGSIRRTAPPVAGI